MATTFDRIREMIIREFELPPERLQRDTLLEEIELDSLAITELVFEIEDEFRITAENTIPPFKTLGDIADYVTRLVAERDAKPRSAPKRDTKPSSVPKRAAAKAKRTSTARPRAAAANGSGVARPARSAKRGAPPTRAGGTPPRQRKRSSARGGARVR
jgi:acyl carrier protein